MTKILKTWRLLDFTMEDAIWLAELGIEFKYSGSECNTVYTMGGTMHVAGHPGEFTFVTVTSEEEMLVVLKFTGRLNLKSTVEYSSATITF